MRIALILGAGATLAEAHHLRDKGVSGELPPLDATFFDTLVALGTKVPPPLRKYAIEVLGVDPFARDTAKPRMEEFFKDVFYDFIQERKKDGPYAEIYGQLVRIYRGLLLRTTNWVCAGTGEGPLPGLIAAAADAANYLDIITFNHDLLIENVLADLSEARGRWCLRHGYGHFAARRRFTFLKSVNTFNDPKTCKHSRPIRVYKLHGSLNWYIDSDSVIPDGAALRGERGPGQRIYVTRQRQVRSTLRRHGKSSWPVLIPPVYAKQPFIRNFMEPVWGDARRALAACNRLVFYGYSMPLLDIEAEKEFQRAIARNAHLAYVDVVNPDAGVATRYARALARVSVRWHGDLDRYLAGAPFA